MKDVVFRGRLLRVVGSTLAPLDACFRELSPEEETKFVAWAKSQPEGVKVQGIWHPVVQNELLLSGRGEE